MIGIGMALGMRLPSTGSLRSLHVAAAGAAGTPKQIGRKVFSSSSSEPSIAPTPKPVVASSSSSKEEPPLSTAGMLFFGSLCVSTFGLGCWQADRFFSKRDLMTQRELELSKEPQELENHARCSATELANPPSPPEQEPLERMEPFRRLLVHGTFRHQHEVLVGPRGPPLGAISQSGPNSGRSAGMATSPQGYFVITPLERSDGRGTVLINRGWVPLSHVKQGIPWSRPSGEPLHIVGVASKTEQPRFLSPPHNPKEPAKLLWFDRTAIEAVTQTNGLSPLLLTQTCGRSSSNDSLDFPLQPDAASVGEFKVTPPVHAGYAATWFGLSGAGILMTRKLLMRGRGG